MAHAQRAINVLKQFAATCARSRVAVSPTSRQLYHIAVPPTPPRPPRWILPPINWEQFMGVKLFAWLGGLGLFLGVGFFVKYSFERDLIPPEVRVALGFLVGVALLAAGVRLAGKRY